MRTKGVMTALSITMAGALTMVIAAPHDTLTVHVVPDLSTLSFVDLDLSGSPTAGEPFIIEGSVFAEDTTTLIGHYLCRGFFIAVQADGDFTFVHQSFEIHGRGTIEVEGNESPNVTVRAIDGATGDFEGEGTLTAEPMPTASNPFIFRGTFDFD